MSDGLLSDADLGIGQSKLLSDEDLGIGARPAPKLTSGEQQALADEAKIKAAEGITPESVKAGTYSALNTALFGAPSHAVALGTYLSGKRPYSEVYKEQKEYEDALARRSPIAAKVGTGAGFVGGMAVPLGPLAKAGQLAKAAVAPRVGELAGRGAEAATTGALLSGAGSYIESGGPFAAEEGAAAKALRDAGVGAAAGAVLGPAIGGIASRLAKGPAVVDAAGDLSPAALKAVDEAFGKRLSAEDIQRIRPQLEEVMGQKGISVAAAKEALLQAEGVQAGKSMVTGKKPPASAAEAAEEAAMAGREQITKAAEKLAKEAPTDVSMASALHRMEREAYNEANAQYERTFSNAGEFTKDFLKGLAPKIQQGLRNENLPDSIDLYKNMANFVYAPQALKLIENVSVGTLPLRQPANMRNLDLVFQSLGELGRKAEGKDRMAISAIKRSFMDALDEGVQTSMFTGNGKKVLADLRDSRQLWSDYKKTFYGKDTANAVFRKAMQEFRDESGNILPIGQLDAASERTANSILASNMLKPNMGAKVFNKLEGALGKDSEGMDAVKAYLRSSPFNVQNNLADLPKSIDDFLRPDNRLLASKVFSPAEISQMRRLSEATKIINSRKVSDEEKEGLFVKSAKRLAPALIGGIAGSFHGIPGSILGSLAAESIGSGVRGLAKSVQIGAEKAGAPVVRPEVVIPAPVRNVPGLYPVEEESGYGMPPDRMGRADGGKVTGAESHADRLVAMAEKAKHNLGRETKPLLNAPDEHIAKALEIANRHI